MKRFTLIELIAITALLSILAATLLISMHSLERRTARVAIVGSARSVQAAVDFFAKENNGALPTAERPTVYSPQRVDFTLIISGNLRNLPLAGDAFYWVDSAGKVWASTIDMPGGVSFEGGRLSWQPVNGSVEYIVYEITESPLGGTLSTLTRAIVARTTLPFYDDLSEGRYLVSAVDLHGLKTPPVGEGERSPVEPSPVKPTAVIGMSPSSGVTTETVVSWYSSSIAHKGASIEAEEWRLNERPILESPPEKAFPAGENRAALRVKDSQGIWSDWTYRDFYVTQLPAKWDSFSAGEDHVLAIRNGELFAWGRNNDGQLGTGDNNTRLSPIRIGSRSDWERVSAGNRYSLAIANGELFAWGRNSDGQLGLGDTTRRNSPVRVGDKSNWKEISARYRHSLGIANGELFAWGRNNDGQLGLGNSSRRENPVRVGLRADWTHVSAGGDHSLAIANGELFSWGRNNDGQLGHGDNLDRDRPARVGGFSGWTEIAAGDRHSLAILNGRMFAWGHNNDGELGLTGNTDEESPVQVGTRDDWERVSTWNRHSLGIANGELFAWGRNNDGRLGVINASPQSLPIRVGEDYSWTYVSAGDRFSLATRGGELLSWGWNGHGQLGLGNSENSDIPLGVVSP